MNLVEPGTLYGDRVNEFDIRLAKILRFGRTRTNVGFDLYNILNSSPILSYNQAFSPTIRPAGRGRVAGADGRAAAAVLEVQRAGGLLEGQSRQLRRKGQRAGG